MRALRRSRSAPLNSGLASVPTAASQIAHSTMKCTSPLPGTSAMIACPISQPVPTTMTAMSNRKAMCLNGWCRVCRMTISASNPNWMRMSLATTASAAPSGPSCGIRTKDSAGEDHELEALGPDQEIAAIAMIGEDQSQQRRRDGRRAEQQRHGERRVIGDAAMGPQREEVRPERQQARDDQTGEAGHEHRAVGIEPAQPILVADRMVVAEFGGER